AILATISLSAVTSYDSATCLYFFFFFNDPAPTEIYTLSLHDALPISRRGHRVIYTSGSIALAVLEYTLNYKHRGWVPATVLIVRSEEHTSELQSLAYLVCRLLLEKKKQTNEQSSSHTNTVTCQENL